MRVVPAVDILDGRCVNLVQGDYGQSTVFSDDPVAQGIAFRDAGADLVHIVDLEGAKAGRCCVEVELRALKDAGVAFEVGGGIRTIETVEQVVSAGAERVILGTAAHNDPEFLKAAAKAFPDQIVVGIDAKAGKVAVRGWLDVTETDAVTFARTVASAGASRIIYTDILRDGMMGGLNLDKTRDVASAVEIPVTASGGVSKLDDLRAVMALEEAGVDEVIVGRALYVGAFTLEEALELAGAGA